MKINQSYDKEVDAVYLKFSDNKVYRTKEVKPGIIVDFDRNEHIIGVEVLNAVKRKFSFSIVETPKKNFNSAAISTEIAKVELPMQAYA